MSVIEYASVGLQLGVESTSGSTTAANKRLLGLSLDPQVAIETEQHKPSGFKVPTGSSVTTNQTTGTAEGPIDYNTLVYPLSSLFGAATITAGEDADEAPDGSYSWEWEFTGKGSITPKSYTFESGVGTNGKRFNFGVFAGLELSIDRTGENSMSADVFGQALTTGVTMTDSPTEIPIVPVSGTHWDVYCDATAENLGTTKLANLYEAGLSMGDLLSQEWTINSQNASFNAVYGNSEPSFDWNMTVSADSVATGFIADGLAGTKRFFRLQATGPQIATGVNHSITIDFCAMVTDFDAFSEDDGKYTLPINFTLAYDETWAKAMTVSIVNKLATL